MAQWGRNDQAVTANSTTTKETSNGAPIGTYTAVKLGGGANAHFGNTSAGSRAATDVAMFNNTTPSAFLSGQAVGVFGVDATEAGVKSGNIALTYVTSGGSGYGANVGTTITFANGTTNTTCVNTTVGTTGANAGRVTALNINIASSGLKTNPTVVVDLPTAINITANSSGFSNTTDTLAVTSADTKWQVGDRLYYGVPTGNTAIAPLTGNTYYYVSFVNSTAIALSSTSGGANVNITDARTTNPGETHTIQGDRATGYLVINGAQGVSHAGWVVRREGTGGRAGRVHYETLVAMGSLGAQTAAYGTPASVADASDDTILPDA